MTPQNGLAPYSSFTSAASGSAPLRMSTGQVAASTRTEATRPISGPTPPSRSPPESRRHRAARDLRRRAVDLKSIAASTAARARLTRFPFGAATGLAVDSGSITAGTNIVSGRF